MKSFTKYILLFMVSSAVAQDNNEKILAFVNDNIGKRVGTGWCSELTSYAIRTFDKTYNVKKWYGKKIFNKRKVKPGDFVLFKNALCEDGLYSYHVAILYGKTKDGKYILAHQNVEDKVGFITRKDSKVVLTELSSLRPKRGKIICYRYN